MLLFSTLTNPKLEKRLLSSKKIKKGRVEYDKFSNKELIVRLKENVKAKNVLAMGSTFPPSDNIILLLELINALKENGAKKVTAVIPHLGYARQNHGFYKGEPLTAKLIIKFIRVAGADKVLVVDLHDSSHNKDFFDYPFKNISAIEAFAGKLKNIKKAVFVSADNEVRWMCERLSKLLHGQPVASMKKIRPRPNVVASSSCDKPELIKGRNVVLCDDMVDTAGTIMRDIEYLKSKGANDIYVAAAHAILSGPGVSRLKKMPVKKYLFADTIPIPPEKKLKNMEIVSVADLILKETVK